MKADFLEEVLEIGCEEPINRNMAVVIKIRGGQTVIQHIFVPVFWDVGFIHFLLRHFAKADASNPAIVDE